MIFHKHALETLSKTEHDIIAREHRQLVKYLNQLRDACECSKEPNTPAKCKTNMLASCQGRFPSYLYHIIELASKHFIHEEMIMLRQPDVTEDYEHFQKHYKAHAKIMAKLHRMVDACFSNINQEDLISRLYRDFYLDITKLFDAHDKAFDNPFLKTH